MARFQFEVERASKAARAARAAEFEGFLAWCRSPLFLSPGELGVLEAPVRSESPRLELQDVEVWSDSFKRALAGLAAR